MVANFPHLVGEVSDNMQLFRRKNMKSATGWNRGWAGDVLKKFWRCGVCWKPAAVHILFCKTTACHPTVRALSGKFEFTVDKLVRGCYFVCR